MRAVHIVPGDSAAGSLRLALGDSPDHVIVGLRDPLSCGPLPATSSLDDWATIRHQFWHTVGGLPDGAVPTDVLPDIALLEQAESISVWLGNGLGDQICLVWIYWVLSIARIDQDRLRIVQFPQDFSERHHTPSIAMLTPEEILRRPPAVALSPGDRQILERAWDALTSATPFKLIDLIRSEADRLPLVRSLARLARRYPQADTGLTHWDRLLLSNTAEHGPRGAYIVGHTLGGFGWDTDPVGDIWLLWRLRRLADVRLKYRLVEFDGDPFFLRGLNVTLTAAGREILSGKANAAQLNGVDDWVGGVHLDSSVGNVWFASGGLIIA